MAINIEDGVVVGNVEDKSNPTNPLAARLIRGFDTEVVDLLRGLELGDLHEIGCGEGRLTRILLELPVGGVRASDISRKLIEESSKSSDLQGVDLVCRSIYDLSAEEDAADTVVCCEVLEHLEDPRRGLRALRSLGARHYLLSVPREPIWRFLNVCRGKYLSSLGNTPGHLNHWSSSGFVAFLEGEGFSTIDVRRPLPWTMAYGRFRA